MKLPKKKLPNPSNAWLALPEELRQSGRFVLYRAAKPGDGKKPRKIPYNPNNPVQCASSADLETGASFIATEKAFTTYPTFSGIFAFCTPQFTFVDLDDCATPDGGPNEAAQKVIDALPKTYWERSPSGTGFHGIFHSKGGIYLPKAEGSLIEAFSERHFMSVTGAALSPITKIATLRPKDIKLLERGHKTATAPRVEDNADADSVTVGRHRSLLRVGGSLMRLGSSFPAADEAMRRYNEERCVPPLEEKEIVESYGGELLFTPGDIVYSSSAVIENAPPNLAYHKLGSLMDAEGITFNRLRDVVNSFGGIKIHVVGDTIVDSYTYCTLIGGNTKTPTFSVKFDRQIDFVGGAGIVAKHMQKAKADVTLTTVLGDDGLKDFVRRDLEEHGVRCDPVIDPTRPTTQKNMFTAGGYRLLKVDSVDNRSISEKIANTFAQRIAEEKGDAVVFSDFRHGIFNRSTIPQLTQAIPEGPLRIADSQVATRWGNILDFQGFDLITPNEREARFALGDQDSIIRPLALDLYVKTKCKYLMLKLGERGIITYRTPDPNVRSFFILDSFTEHVVDPIGAGDALLAYATMSLVNTGDPLIASVLGSVAAADLTGIQWAIVGGESGPRARPMAEEWVGEIEVACRNSGAAFFFKQWGGVHKSKTGRSLDGRTHDEQPKRLSHPALPPAERFALIRKWEGQAILAS